MERERGVLSILVILLVVLWLGFEVHHSPRFPGSLAGGVFALTGASLMVLFSLAYIAAKRIGSLRQKLSTRISTASILKWHVYTSALGAILAMLHTGHRFESDLGIALTAFMLITVLSGYIGRHLVGRVSMELRDKRDHLAKLETAYNEKVGQLLRNTTYVPAIDASNISLSWFGRSKLRVVGARFAPGAYEAVRIADSIAELEYAIRFHEHFKRLASVWVKMHLAAALIFYVLLGLHIWSAIHFGLRWFK